MGIIKQMFGTAATGGPQEQQGAHPGFLKDGKLRPMPKVVCACGHVAGDHQPKCSKEGCHCEGWQPNLRKGDCINCACNADAHNHDEACVSNDGKGCGCLDYVPFTKRRKRGRNTSAWDRMLARAGWGGIRTRLEE